MFLSNTTLNTIHRVQHLFLGNITIFFLKAVRPIYTTATMM